MSHPSKYKDRVVTKQADEVLAGDRLWRTNGLHPVITKAASNGLYAGFAWTEDGQHKTRTMLAGAEVQIVLPNG